MSQGYCRLFEVNSLMKSLPSRAFTNNQMLLWSYEVDIKQILSVAF